MLSENKKNEYSTFIKEKLVDKGWQFIESKENNIIFFRFNKLPSFINEFFFNKGRIFIFFIFRKHMILLLI